MSWEKTRLSDCTVYITDGDHQPAPKSESGIKFIKIKDIQNGQISFNANLFVPIDYYDNLPSERKPKQNDILYSVVGSYGQAAFVNTREPFCFERNIALLHPGENIVPRFLFYAISSTDFLLQASNAAIGAAQKLISLSRLKNMVIPYPPIEHQHRIVDILSAYDDLIENNRKQIKLLEEAAQRLYKEWFVDLRFPGYEHTKITDGVPEGWEKCSLGDVIKFDPKVQLAKDRVKQFVPMSALSTSSMVLDMAEFREITSNSGSKFQNDDTLLARITPCLENGKTAFVHGIQSPEGAVGSTEYIVMRSKYLNPYMVYLHARTDGFRQSAINSMSGSDGRQRVKADKLKALSYLLPPTTVVNQFGLFAAPIFELVFDLNEQSFQATQARDRLLPKLMNGEEEVL